MQTECPAGKHTYVVINGLWTFSVKQRGIICVRDMQLSEACDMLYLADCDVLL